MFDSLKIKVAAGFLQSLLRSLATNKNTQTTVTGVIAGAILAINGLSLSGVIQGDPHQIALLVSSLAVAALGTIATRANRDGHATLLGVVAGAAQAYTGDFITGIVLAVCGYLTNKPVSVAPSSAGGNQRGLLIRPDGSVGVDNAPLPGTQRAMIEHSRDMCVLAMAASAGGMPA